MTLKQRRAARVRPTLANADTATILDAQIAEQEAWSAVRKALRELRKARAFGSVTYNEAILDLMKVQAKHHIRGE